MSKNLSKKKKILIIAGIVVIIGAVAAANLLQKDDKAESVQMDTVKKGTIIQTVSASGKIRPVVQVKISAKVSGNITELKVQEGDSVRKGQLLLKLDREKYEAVKERAESALKSSHASLWKAQAEYDRMKELFGKKLASEADLQTAEALLRLAESEVDMQKASLKEITDDLSKTEIYSPMSGVVSELNKEVGEMVLGASFQEDVIMVVADLRNMEAEVDVDENDVVNIALGDPVEIEIDAFADTTFKGKVTRIANTGNTTGLGTQEEITNFKVEIALLENVKGIRPGMSATADIEVARHDSVLYVPIQCIAMRSPSDTAKVVLKKEKKNKKDASKESGTAVSDTTSKTGKKGDTMLEVVFVVTEGDTARIFPVKTGITSETDIEILSGLELGQKIVSGPYRVLATKIRNGEKVKEDKEIKSSAASSQSGHID